MAGPVPSEPRVSGLCAAASLRPQSTNRDPEPILIGRRCACLGSSTRLGCGWLPGDGQGREAQRAVPHPPLRDPDPHDCRRRPELGVQAAIPDPREGGRSAGPPLLLAVPILPACPALHPPPAKGSRAPVCLGLRSPPQKLLGSLLQGRSALGRRPSWRLQHTAAGTGGQHTAAGTGGGPDRLSQDKAAEPLSCLRSPRQFPQGTDRVDPAGRGPPPGTVMGGGGVTGRGGYRSPHTSLGRSGLLLRVHREDRRPRGKQVRRAEALGVSPLAG